MEHDFDYMKNLYIEDPVKFKELTDKMIDDTINRTRPEKREQLRAKQWRLQQELDKIADPLERMNRMVSIFWKGVYDFKGVLNNPYESLQPKKDSEPSNIVEFKKKIQKA